MARKITFVSWLAGGLLLGGSGCGDAPPATPPRQLSASTFHYPEEMWDAGVEGETLLKLFVSDQGGVDSVRVEQASGHAPFDTSAVEGARELRFEPARRGDEAIGIWVLLPVQFRLDGNAAAPDSSEQGR